eukprot:Opistho-2@22820
MDASSIVLHSDPRAFYLLAVGMFRFFLSGVVAAGLHRMCACVPCLCVGFLRSLSSLVHSGLTTDSRPLVIVCAASVKALFVGIAFVWCHLRVRCFFVFVVGPLKTKYIE